VKDRLLSLLIHYQTRSPHESPVVERFLSFLQSGEVVQGKRNPLRHITASAWIVSPDRSLALLTFHAKLNIWVQLGGHTDEGEDWAGAALREAKEESGLTRLRLLDTQIFDLDIHRIPARGSPNTPEYSPAHEHYDLRFLIEADPSDSLVLSSESHDLAWVPVSRLGDWTTEDSQHRMAAKVKAGWKVSSPAG